MATLSDDEYTKLEEVLKRRAIELKNEREEKARRFEAFINEKLKVDLKKTLMERDKVYQQISQYLEVSIPLGLFSYVYVLLCTDFCAAAFVYSSFSIIIFVILNFVPSAE